LSNIDINNLVMPGITRNACMVLMSYLPSRWRSVMAPSIGDGVYDGISDMQSRQMSALFNLHNFIVNDLPTGGVATLLRSLSLKWNLSSF
jgi:hypothetical protein